RLSVSLFYHATATTEIYTLSLHDALPICSERGDVCLDRNVSIERSLSERMIADARQAGLAGVGLVAAEPFGQHVTDLEMLGLFRGTERQEQLRVHAQRAGLQTKADQQRRALRQAGIDTPGAS